MHGRIPAIERLDYTNRVVTETGGRADGRVETNNAQSDKDSRSVGGAPPSESEDGYGSGETDVNVYLKADSSGEVYSDDDLGRPLNFQGRALSDSADDDWEERLSIDREIREVEGRAAYPY
jgi:hypothetical protein